MEGVSLVKSVKEKVARLIADNRRLRREHKASEARAERFRVRNDELSRRVAELENRITAMETARALGGSDGDAKIARARINRLMREVDKCIALLNR